MVVRTKKSDLIQLKVLFIIMVILAMISSVFTYHSVDAATKEYTSYKKLKLGMTATDVAKSLYENRIRNILRKSMASRHSITR